MYSKPFTAVTYLTERVEVHAIKSINCEDTPVSIITGSWCRFSLNCHTVSVKNIVAVMCGCRENCNVSVWTDEQKKGHHGHYRDNYTNPQSEGGIMANHKRLVQGWPNTPSHNRLRTTIQKQ